MKILRNKIYNELVNSNSRLQSKLNSEISENTFLKAENASKNIIIMMLNKKALKYDAELERQRIKNQKYRDAKKAKAPEVPEVSGIEKFVKENLGKNIETTEGFGKICGYSSEKNYILIGFNDLTGWANPEKCNSISLKKYKTYWHQSVEDVKQQLSKTK